MSISAKRVCITGAAGQIGYALTFAVARGDIYGPDTPVILHLLDIPPMIGKLEGVKMEVDDCAFPLVARVVCTADPDVAFKGIHMCLMVGAFPRKAGMERKDLLKANAGIFAAQGASLAKFASPDVKVVVVGNPANTNCLLLQATAKGLASACFSALTRLDHNRAKSQIANRLGVSVGKVKNVIIWGNHSSTQYPDVNHGYIADFPTKGTNTPIREAINDDEWIDGLFIGTVQQRGAAVIKARGASSAASAANAIVDHARDWVQGTHSDEIVSMAIPSDGSYGIAPGIIYSFPVKCNGGAVTIVKGLDINERSQAAMDATEKELREEREQALAFIN